MTEIAKFLVGLGLGYVFLSTLIVWAACRIAAWSDRHQRMH